MTKPDPMFKDDEGEHRRAWLLVGNLGYLMALEAVGLDRCAGALVDKIAAGIARKPKRRERYLRKVAERRRATLRR